MNVYASLVVADGGWGDGFPALFICEQLKRQNPDWKFYIHDGPCMGSGFKDRTFRHRNFIKKPWFVEEFIEIPNSSDFDKVVSTHGTHPYYSPDQDGLEFQRAPQGGFLPQMKYGREPIELLNFHSDRAMVELRNAGFRATVEVLDPPELPEEYVAVQFRRQDHKEPSRDFVSGDEHDFCAKRFLSKLDMPVVSVSDYVGGIDMSHVNLWQKIHIAQHSQKLYAAHSGFGMVMAMYAKKAEVINCSGTQRNPSIGVFDNVKADLFPQQPGPYVTAKYTLRPV